jgi:hypothetical protein
MAHPALSLVVRDVTAKIALRADDTVAGTADDPLRMARLGSRRRRSRSAADLPARP